ALVELQLARNPPAMAARVDRNRTRHGGSKVVAIEQLRLADIEVEVEGGASTRKIDRACSADRSTGRRSPGSRVEDQPRSAEPTAGVKALDDHAGDRALDARVLRLQ